MDQGSPPRASGLRQVRRWSNWTAAALIGATALTTAYFAHSTVTAAPAVAVPLGTAGAASRLGPGAAPGTGRPCVYVPVATSGASGIRAQTPVLSCGPGTGTPAVLAPGQVGSGPGGWDHEAEGHDS